MPPGGTREFLAGLPVEALGRPALADLLRRLGVRTLGDFAALPAGGRAGPVRLRRRRWRTGSPAAGTTARSRSGSRPPTWTSPPTTTSRSTGSTPPRSPPGRSPSGCTSGWPGTGWPAPGSASRRSPRTARSCTGSGGTTACSPPPPSPTGSAGSSTAGSPAATAGAGRARPARPPGSSGCGWCPTGCSPSAGLQPGLWGEAGEERERAHRALSRVQGILGPEAVVTAVLGGGRSPADQMRLVPWGDERAARPSRPATRPGPVSRRSGRLLRCSAVGGSPLSSVTPWGPVRGDGPGGAGRWPSRRGRGGLPPPSPAVVLPGPAARRRARRRPGRRSWSARGSAVSARAGPAHRRRRPPGRDHRVGRAVAGGRALVGAGRGAPPGPVPGVPGRRPRLLLAVEAGMAGGGDL